MQERITKRKTVAVGIKVKEEEVPLGSYASGDSGVLFYYFEVRYLVPLVYLIVGLFLRTIHDGYVPTNRLSSK